VESASLERVDPRRDSQATAARKRAAVETYARNESALRRTARRYSLCEDDADDALQRSLEILLRKAPTADPRELVKWTQTVVKHEALAIRSERERVLPAPEKSEGGFEDWVALLPSGADGPAERAEKRELFARSREALGELKPQELRALTLLAQGYSYAEIGEITSWSRTKINRCLAEGRERLRALIASSEDGGRCAELRPSISAFCDGEAGPEENAKVREHLRACSHCRATVRAYRAAPATAAALAPALPLHRSLLERARDALGNLSERFGGGGGSEAATQLASGGGASGAGIATVVKVAAICISGAGGAAACVAGGLVASPLDSDAERGRPPLERQAEAADRGSDSIAGGRSAVEAPPPWSKPEAKPQPPEARPDPPSEPAPAAAEPAPEVVEPVTSDPVEPAPEAPPQPAPEPVPAAAAGESAGGSPAGEFGP
jgi:RNA polymerase sigma factor (sigma-70 family)